MTKNDIPTPGVGYTNFRRLFLLDDDTLVRLTVPDYQRSYDWRTEHRKDLFDDLDRLERLSQAGKLDSNAGHFCGTIICTPDNTTSSLLEYSIVDGQQRLTTLAILHSRLSKAEGIDPFLIADGKILFRPQSADRNYFSSIVRDVNRGEPATLGQGHYADAATEIDSWIASFEDTSKIQSMRELIETRLQFIFFALPNAQEVSKVFETINNRGKPLTQMDLVKNHLIYMRSVHDWDGQVNEVWARIQQLALKTDFQRNENVDTVIRAVVTAMFHPGRRDRNETTHSIIKKHICEASHSTVYDRFLRFLESSFETFFKLRNSHTTGREHVIGTQLTYLNNHPNISGALPLILVRQFCRLDEQGADVLTAIEKANFRLYGLLNAAKRSNSHHVALHKLAHRYFTEHCNKTSNTSEIDRAVLAKELIADLTDIVTQQHQDGFGQIIKALTLDDDDGTDYYHWDALPYFLARWEESLLTNQSFEYKRLHRNSHGALSNDYLAKEHIYPSKGDDSIANYKSRILLRRLGNFMLLPQGVNSSLSNKSPTEKVKLFPDHECRNNLLVQNSTLDSYLVGAKDFVTHLETRKDDTFGAIGRNRFNAQTRAPNRSVAEAKTLCDLREEQMIRFALEAWRMPGENLGDQSGERFLGMFSFKFDDDAYKSTHERLATKEPTNYVLEHAPEGKPTDRPASPLEARLAKRNKILGSDFTPLTWDEVESIQIKAA